MSICELLVCNLLKLRTRSLKFLVIL